MFYHVLAPLLLAAVFGAAWRRWWGSARPQYAKNNDGSDRPGYRALQVIVGIAVLTMICSELIGGPFKNSIYATALAGATVGFMTLPIRISRRPFEYMIAPFVNELPMTSSPELQGPAPWSEVFQGAIMFAGAAAIALFWGLIRSWLI